MLGGIAAVAQLVKENTPVKNKEAIIRSGSSSSSTASKAKTVKTTKSQTVTTTAVPPAKKATFVGTTAETESGTEHTTAKREVVGPPTPQQFVSQTNERLSSFKNKVAGISEYKDVSSLYAEGQSLLRGLEKCRSYVDEERYSSTKQALKQTVDALGEYQKKLGLTYATDKERTTAIRLGQVIRTYGDKLTYGQVQEAIRDLDERLASGEGNVSQLKGQRAILQDAGIYGLYGDTESYDRAIKDLEKKILEEDLRVASRHNFSLLTSKVADIILDDEERDRLRTKKSQTQSLKAALVREQDRQAYERYRSDTDFSHYATPQKETGLDKYGIQDQTYYLINRHLGDDADLTDAEFEFKYGGGSHATNEVAFRITDDERDLYNYLYAKNGAKSANAYLDKVVYPRINDEIAGEIAESAQEFTKKHPVLASFSTFATKVVSTIEATPMMLIDQEEYRRNSAQYERSINYTNNVRQTCAAKCDEVLPGSDVLYNATMSLGDMAVSLAISKGVSTVAGGLGVTGKIAGVLAKAGIADDVVYSAAQTAVTKNITSALMASQAAAQTMADARSRGLSDMEILGEGLTTIAVEFGTERIGLNKLLDAPKTTLKTILSTALTNVGEETLAAVANTMADRLIAGENSRWELSVRSYVQQGYSYAEAEKLTLCDNLKEVSTEAAVALVAGTMASGSKAAYAALTDASICRDVSLNIRTDLTNARKWASDLVSKHNSDVLSTRGLLTAISNTRTAGEALTLSAVPEVLKHGTVVDRAGTDTAVGEMVSVNGVPHTVVVRVEHQSDGTAQAKGVILDGSTYFDLAKSEKVGYNKNEAVTDADLTAALLEDWGHTEAAKAKRESASGKSDKPVTDDDLAAALLEDWGKASGGSRKAHPSYDGLTESQKAEIKQKAQWSDEIISYIRSIDEAQKYMDFGLVEMSLGDRLCLIPRDLDLEYKDGWGRTNRERLKKGKPLCGKDGKSYEVHHIGQQMDSPFAIISSTQHRGKGIDAILHNKKQPTQIDRRLFNKQKRAMWKELIRQIEEKENEL